ncbi:sensor histidine kinase [Novispirillum sp. DQ9]|uniref:sensor histidine kinase n=1 Tax=Novispirillum sp. DQ9 TaxID=3398612 RepID=UPI003C7E0F00
MSPSPAPPLPPRSLPPCRLPLWHSLSGRLLVLTVLFVLLAEVLIFVPSVARFRVTALEDRLGSALLALTAVQAHPEGMVDMDLQRRLLRQAGTLGMSAWGPERRRTTLGPDMPPKVDASYDISDRPPGPLIRQALAALVRTEPRVIAVRGHPPQEPQTWVEVVVEERPLIAAMRDYGWRILVLSLIISLVTAALVYLSLHVLLVRPLRRLSASMQAFAEAPEDPARVLRPSRRRDEVGLAERELAALQARLRDALGQQARLAAVGTAVSKISHDLKGVLTTAVLESDRLEATAAADPEVKHVTAGIARALDRAIALTGATLRFAKEGPPCPRLGTLALLPVAREAAAVAERLGCACTLDMPPGLTARADGELLLRVLENLLCNAAEAGAPTARVSAEARGGAVHLTVADSGPGLPPRALENLFVPFSGSARVGGTGLGLPIARDLMRAQGGTLVLERSGPDGAVFILTLPASA